MEMSKKEGRVSELSLSMNSVVGTHSSPKDE